MSTEKKTPSLVRRAAWTFASYLGSRGRRWAWDRRHAARAPDTDGTRSKRTTELVRQYLGGGRVLEIGCGSGELAAEIAIDVSHYVGVDISAEAIRKAESRWLPRSSFIAEDAQYLVPRRGYYDVVLLEDTLHCLRPPEQRALLQRCFDGLDDNGCVIVVVHDADKHAETISLAISEAGRVEHAEDVMSLGGACGAYLVLRGTTR